MEEVTSADGTVIAFEKSGSGPALILVHGVAGDHTRWGPLLPFLEPHFTVLAMDRRGRGQSGDSAQYAIEREYEDLVAVARAVDVPVDVYGHSHGATVALEAALSISNLQHLVIYEPVSPFGDPVPSSLPERLQAQVDRDDREGALIEFFRSALEMSEDEIEHFRTLPSWPSRVDAAFALPREIRAGEEYRFSSERFAHMSAPTLLLVGSESTEEVRNSMSHLAQELPECRIHVLESQHHLADAMAPNQVAEALISFLRTA